MLVSPLDDYVAHNRASRRKTSFGSLRLQFRKDFADQVAAIVMENPSLSYLAAARLVADGYNVDIVDTRDGGNLKKLVCDRVQAIKQRRDAVLCLSVEEHVEDVEDTAVVEKPSSKSARGAKTHLEYQ